MHTRLPWWLLLCAIAWGLRAPSAFAGAWTLPNERWYVEYFYRYFGSKHEFNDAGNSGRRASTAVYRDIRNELKLEYGLTDSINLLASAPYISAHYRDDNIDLLRTGIGDIYLRTKIRALEQPLVVSTQFSWKIAETYDPVENPLGDGQTDFETRLQLSKGWTFGRDRAMRDAVMDATLSLEQTKRRSAAGVAFVNFEIGFNARNEAPANEVPMVFEMGFTPMKRLMLVGSLDGVVGIRSTHEQIENYAKWGLRAIVNMRGDGFATVFREGDESEPTVNLEFGYNDIFAGRNTADAWELFAKLGVFF